MIINTINPNFDIKLLRNEEKEEQKSILKEIEEAVSDISKDKKHKTIDEKIIRPNIKTQNLTEEAIFYFQEPKTKVDYDFSYIGNLKKPVFSSYDGANINNQETNKIDTKIQEIITNNVLNHIITVQKMDTLLGTRTGFIHLGVKERFDFLKRLSFYEAIVRVNYDLHT